MSEAKLDTPPSPEVLVETNALTGYEPVRFSVLHELVKLVQLYNLQRGVPYGEASKLEEGPVARSEKLIAEWAKCDVGRVRMAASAMCDVAALAFPKEGR